FLPINLVKPNSLAQNMMETEETNSFGKIVKISKISDSVVNPEPMKIDESVLLDDFLSPRRLRALTGVEDLEKVTQLEMQVDTGEASLGNFGVHLPNLRQLKLSNSIIPSVRDLGSCLFNLSVLWMPQCCLENLDGIASMARLRELYLSYNEIVDVSPCGMLEHLEILDLEGNLIDDIHNVMYLSMCSQLRQLSLEGNPVCSRPGPKEDAAGYNYREEVLRMLPSLQCLDDVPTGERDPNPQLRQATLQFDEHWNYINSLLQESGMLATAASSESLDTSSGIGSTLPSSNRPRTGASTAAASSASLPPRPQSALRMPSAQKRLMTSKGRPGTANRPGSALIRPGSAASNASSADDLMDRSDESALTAGTVVCGNISKALRRRRSPQSGGGGSSGASTATAAAASSSLSSPGGFERRPQTAAGAFFARRSAACFGQQQQRGQQQQQQSRQKITEFKDDETFDRDHAKLVEELKSWKVEYEKSVRRIRSERAPQVLAVTHDESVELGCSDDDDDDVDDEDAPTGNDARPPAAAAAASAARPVPDPDSARSSPPSSASSGSLFHRGSSNPFATATGGRPHTAADLAPLAASSSLSSRLRRQMPTGGPAGGLLPNRLSLNSK
ncbi:hypothetical protein BOX15_Mlig007237g3, partial [Macrostomum lignano]